MLRVFNDTARYLDQGGGKRKGTFAIYLEPWQVDVLEFLELRKNHGNELHRARDLFYALWMGAHLQFQVHCMREVAKYWQGTASKSAALDRDKSTAERLLDLTSQIPNAMKREKW
ncbi:hypothetical protein PsorP6_014793 [Peronosclerospora sorghi]|uniref:Uncharacterized protein n=1 Tax=Peronosclerospora sorghi TaxID=230839 RepID=A0ACC0VS00_9STRA|nr:hypothetical protein PsorP6_014793 [Peronosclerospora sorghi]